MAIIELNRNPSERELRWFGVGLGLFAGVVGGLIWWRSGEVRVAELVWTAGAAVVAVYYTVRPWRRAFYVAWMGVAFPIGWVVSHVALAGVYYLIVTPIGLLMRAAGRDPLNRRFDRSASSYWIEHNPGADVKRYFRQF